MKKFIGLFVLVVFLSFSSFAQSAELVKLTNNENTNTSPSKVCVPTKECAAKMGMTLEECKKLCTKESATTKVASVSSESTEGDSVVSKKECKKTCTKTKVASASAENNIVKTVSLDQMEVKEETKQKCSKKSKCCKKGASKETEKKS